MVVGLPRLVEYVYNWNAFKKLDFNKNSIKQRRMQKCVYTAVNIIVQSACGFKSSPNCAAIVFRSYNHANGLLFPKWIDRDRSWRAATIGWHGSHDSPIERYSDRFLREENIGLLKIKVFFRVLTQRKMSQIINRSGTSVKENEHFLQWYHSLIIEHMNFLGKMCWCCGV